jgi:hypothetical protein
VPVQGSKHQRQQLGIDARGDADPHPSFTTAGAALHELDEIVAGRQQLAAFVNQRLAGRRQLRLAAAANEEHRLQSGLEFLDVETHRWRRQVKPLRRSGERAQVCDGDQRLYLIEVEVTHQDS